MSWQSGEDGNGRYKYSKNCRIKADFHRNWPLGWILSGQKVKTLSLGRVLHLKCIFFTLPSTLRSLKSLMAVWEILQYLLSLGSEDS